MALAAKLFQQCLCKCDLGHIEEQPNQLTKSMTAEALVRTPAASSMLILHNVRNIVKTHWDILKVDKTS